MSPLNMETDICADSCRLYGFERFLRGFPAGYANYPEGTYGSHNNYCLCEHKVIIASVVFICFLLAFIPLNPHFTGLASDMPILNTTTGQLE